MSLLSQNKMYYNWRQEQTEAISILCFLFKEKRNLVLYSKYRQCVHTKLTTELQDKLFEIWHIHFLYNRNTGTVLNRYTWGGRKIDIYQTNSYHNSVICISHLRT